MNDPIVIVSAARTPMGAFQGELKQFAAAELGAAAIRAAVERARIKPEQVDEVIMGCVLPAGQGQAPARQASLGAGLPLATGCTTINKMCGSGMKAAMLAHDLLAVGTNDIMVAGGMESMTNAPYLLAKARGGYRLGHGQLIDHMFYDGLEDAYEKGRLMGSFAEDCAAKYSFTRAEQDKFAVVSLERAQAANKSGAFAWEITPIAIKGGKDERFMEMDESPFKANFDKIPALKPAFKKDGTITAANSSSISDGGAALVMMRRSTAEKLGLAPLALVVGHSTHAQEPGWFTTAPVGAIRKLFDEDRLERGQGRPVRDQRGLRRGDHGGDEGTRPPAREGQHPRRRLRAGPSDRRFGRAHPGDADRRACAKPAASAASPACASAAAKPPRWRSNWFEPS